MPKTARASSGRGTRCSWKRPSAGPPDGAAGSVVLDRTRTEALRKGRRSCEATYCNCSALARSARALLRTARAPRPSRASGGFLQKLPRMRYPFRSPLHTQTGLSIIPLLSAPVAQLDRVSGYEPEGRGFESCLAHHRTICLAAIRTMMRRSGREVECTPLLRVQVQYIGPRGFESLLLRHCSSAARQREAPVSFWMSGFCFA